MNTDESYKIILQENLREYNEKQFVKKLSPRIQFVLTRVVYSAVVCCNKTSKARSFFNRRALFYQVRGELSPEKNESQKEKNKKELIPSSIELLMLHCSSNSNMSSKFSENLLNDVE